MRFALIGCGRIGKRHAEIMSKYGNLVAVCDIIEERANEFARKFKSTPYYDIGYCISNSYADLVAICTPNGYHSTHTTAALNYSNVLVEKPMAISVRECERMIHKAEIFNKRLFVVKQNRFNPPVKEVKKLLDNNSLGKVFSVSLNCYWNREKDYYQDWHGSKLLDGGTLYTQFSHFIDLLYWFFGNVKTVKSITKNYNHKYIEFEDSGVVLLEFDSGVIGSINYNVNCVNKNMEGSLTIFAEKATIKIGGQYLNELEYQEPEMIKNLPPGNPPNNYGTYVGSMSNHLEVYKNIISVLKKNNPVNISCIEALKTVEIIERIYESSIRSGI